MRIDVLLSEGQNSLIEGANVRYIFDSKKKLFAASPPVVADKLLLHLIFWDGALPPEEKSPVFFPENISSEFF